MVTVSSTGSSAFSFYLLEVITWPAATTAVALACAVQGLTNATAIATASISTATTTTTTTENSNNNRKEEEEEDSDFVKQK